MGFSFLVMHRRIKCTLTVSRFQKHSRMLLHKAINQIYLNTEMVKNINTSFKAAFAIIKGKSFQPLATQMSWVQFSENPQTSKVNTFNAL